MSLVAENKEEYNIFDDFPLKQEQVECVDFALSHQNLVCNAQVGCGKTRVGIVFSHRIMKRTNDTVTFVIVPKIANSVWKKELEHAHLKYCIRTTDEKTEKMERYFIFNYSNLDEMEKLLISLRERNFRVIGVYDEVHTVGSADSGVANRLRALRPMFACVLGLSGTPLLNDIQGLYYTVDFCKPGFLGTWWDFKNRWVITEKKTIHVKGGRKRQVEEIKGYRDLDLLKAELSKVVITKSRKYNINYEFRTCRFSPYEDDIYQTAASGLLDPKLDEKQFSARLWDLQRVCDASSDQIQNGDICAKPRLLIDVCREIVMRGEGCIIFTELEDSYTSIKKLLESYHGYIGYSNLYMITGKVKYEDRVYCEKHLKAKDIVIITRAGNKAINLQAVNNIIFYSIPFSVGDVIQTNGRIARTDTTYNQQNVYFLEVSDTIDTYKRILMSDHMDLVRELFGGSSVMPVFDMKPDLEKYKQYFKNKLLWRR